ncbi:Rhomboid protein 2 [Rasamsonia emersonii CBS 393.64]|uniref:Rhomboid protein 2 n=1 Tax=Rasamsonia emersonii (strain ATCC 16479 / CBS 393.64 / IMI 116815) TaxID=1408163 RepID=A0A0F4YYX0_RASE3|nr:Rhomboid protein 2 [Rasamsonia emersonii CBS 393.64]KKA23036.1 Rhomboid protein 2 [Rasamsonia emersonii CBS 393.64]
MATPSALPPFPFDPTRVRSYVVRLPLFTRLVLLVIVAFLLLEIQSVWSVVRWGALVPDEMGIRGMYRLNTYPVIHLGFFHAFLNVLALTPLLERFEAEHGTLTALLLFVGHGSIIADLHDSVWVFLLLGSEAIKTFRANPYFLRTWIPSNLLSIRGGHPLDRSKIKSSWSTSALRVSRPEDTRPVRHSSNDLDGRADCSHELYWVLATVRTMKALGAMYFKQSLHGHSGTEFPQVALSMALISPSLVRKLRNDPYLLFARLPPFVSFICIIVGVVWLLLLPLNEYSRQTYISENALLPGQVHTYFGGSEQNIFRGYKKELEGLLIADEEKGRHGETAPVVSEKLQSIFRASGLKVATQNYEYHSAGAVHQGQNVYAIIQAPRGDATEAIALVASWRTVDGELNLNGVALALTLARYFKRWSLWSKDIIFLITPDSKSGTQAWIDAYHDMHPPSVQALPLKSGALQGALVIEYPFDHRFESLHIVYDGVNGQLPNLDLFNTAVSIASGQMGISANLQEMWEHDDSYEKRLQTMLRGMVKQGLGLATGAHSSFIPYHIDAITLQTKGNGWQDEMALGRTVESLCRSLNNLLEHLHQSFFFYLLMQTNRFVSIGTYMPSAMLIAANFTIMAVALWLRSGYKAAISPSSPSTQGCADEKKSGQGHDAQKSKPSTDAEDNGLNGVLERQLALPLTLVTGLHFLGVVPLYIFNTISSQYFTTATYAFVVISAVLPLIFAVLLTHGPNGSAPTPQQYLLIKSFSLLLLGLFLSALATLNFSLSFMIGLVCAPLSFIGRIPKHPESNKPRVMVNLTTGLGLLLMNLLSPPAVLLAACWYTGIPVSTVLTEAAFGWDVWGMWTPVVVCVAFFQLVILVTFIPREKRERR